MSNFPKLWTVLLLLLPSCVTARDSSTDTPIDQEQSVKIQFNEKPGLWESVEYGYSKCPKLNVINADNDPLQGLPPIQSSSPVWVDFVHDPSGGKKAYLDCFNGVLLTNVPPLKQDVSRLLSMSGLRYLGFPKQERDRELARILEIDPEPIGVACASGKSLVAIVAAYSVSRVASAYRRTDLKNRLGAQCLKMVALVEELHVFACRTKNQIRCTKGISGPLYGILTELDRYGNFSR